jgi:AraC family transcriptional regulator
VTFTEPSRPLFESTLVRVGSFRCPVTHPRFHDSGPAKAHLFVFPRTCVWIRHEGKPTFVADPTLVTLYNPGQVYWRQPISADGDRSDWFSVTPELLREVASAFDPTIADDDAVRFCQMRAPSDPHTYRLQRAVFEHVRNGGDVDVFAVEETVLHVLERVLSSVYGEPAAVPASDRRRRDLVEQARAYLAQHYARKESLADVARGLGCSLFHLCRTFRKYTGTTLHEYRHQLRVRHALERVTSGHTDLLSLALALGYSGHSHFTAAFRSVFGEPPSAIRATQSAALRAAAAQPARPSLPALPALPALIKARASMRATAGAARGADTAGSHSRAFAANLRTPSTT